MVQCLYSVSFRFRKIYFGRQPVSSLRYKDGTTLSKSQCLEDKAWDGPHFMVANTVCTRLGTCAHDDGNPLMQTRGFYTYLVGILSVNGNERDCDSPEVHVRVFPYLSWIRQHLQSNA